MLLYLCIHVRLLVLLFMMWRKKRVRLFIRNVLKEMVVGMAMISMGIEVEVVENVIVLTSSVVKL